MGDGLWWERAHIHPSWFEGAKEFPFWGSLADLNSVCSFGKGKDCRLSMPQQQQFKTSKPSNSSTNNLL